MRWFRQDVLNLPIRTIDFDNPADVAMHDKIVDLVDEMLERHKQLPGLTGEGRKMAERLIATVDGEIDALVYRLYGLSEDEVAIVEGEHQTPAPRPTPLGWGGGGGGIVVYFWG
ncbi:MAG: hypothetical protein F4W97_05625, partial [Chloroflexi bacterium]|nr:hypothetical protein [Chloroflexota bacterium]